MHLFKNKAKDVKQFLEEMKANKTNRSSNQHSLDKTNNSISSSKPSQEQYYHSNSIGNLNHNKQNYDRRGSSREPNQSNQGSINTNTMRFNHTVGNKFYPSPSQPNNQRPGYEQAHIRMQEPRHISSQINHFQHDYIEPSSQPFSYDRSFYNQPYQNLNQPLRSQNFPNPHHDSYGFRKNPVESFPMSQHSNTTNYSVSQQHQNGVKNYQNFYKPPFKPEPSNFMNQSSSYYPQKANQFEVQKNHFNNTQQIYNSRFNQQKPFTSQVSNFDYEMSEICEAEAGLSTQKDSPAKLTEIQSKNKNLDSESKETPMKKISQTNIFEILEDERNISPTKEKIEHQKNEEKQPAQKNLRFIEKNIQLKHQPAQIAKISQQDSQKSKRISVSESQRLKLSKSFSQIDCSYMEVDRLLKQTSILFNNIQRASDDFNKKLRVKGQYAKYLDTNVSKQPQQMEVQSPPHRRDDQTLKKRMNKNNISKDFQNEKTFKKDKRVKEIEI